MEENLKEESKKEDNKKIDIGIMTVFKIMKNIFR